MYNVYVNDVSISQGDKTYDLEFFSSNKFEFDYDRPSPPDDSAQYQKDYLFYKKNPEIYDVTRVVISTRRGILSLDRKRTLRRFMLPI